MKTILDYLEVHVAHHCNINCKGCGHYSNFVKASFPDIVQYTKDVARLRELVPEIQEIRLLGGEPLLNLELPQFISVMREAYPAADLRVVTNGLLIPNADAVLFQMMRDCHVRFDISQYPPTKQRLVEILARCEAESVPFHVSQEVQTFCRFEDTDAPGNVQAIFLNCRLKRCHMMLDGKIAVCPLPILRNAFREYEWANLFTEDIINLYDASLTGEVLVQRLQNPCKLCAYCGNHGELFEWEGNVQKR